MTDSSQQNSHARASASGFLPKAFPFVSDYCHSLGEIALRGPVVALRNGHKERVEYVELGNSCGGVFT
jgi:hypothetical protein